jgi:predicted ATPase
VAVSKGEIDLAEKQMSEIIKMRRAIGDLYNEGADYGNFAIVLLNNGYKEKAKEYALKARKAFEKVGEPTILKQVEGLIAACNE